MNKLDLSNLTRVESISDDHAETISAGSFRFETDGEEGVTSTNFARASLRRGGSTSITRLDITNTNPGRDSILDAGHVFELNFTNRNNDVVYRHTVRFGEGVGRNEIGTAIGRGAVNVGINQGTNVPTAAGNDTCFFGCNSFYQF